MRFERLAIERFGHFESLDIHLPGGPGLVVVHGPNEAGKTTLRQAIRGLLFGVDERTPYAFEYDYRAIALRAVLRDSSGQILEITRLKKRKDSLVGAVRGEFGETPLNALHFSRYFGAITEELYASIFGFSHADLQQGSEVLQAAGLSELLGGGALGGSAEKIRLALGNLELAGESLFKAKGKNPAINRHLTHLRDVKASLREAVLLQPQYAALTSGLAIAREEAASTERDLAALRLREARLHTLLAAFEDFHEHLGLERTLADPSLDTPLDEASAERARALAAELSSLDARLRLLDGELRRLLERAAQADADPALLAEAPAVERLFRRLDVAAEHRLSLPRERERLTREAALLESALAALSPQTRPEEHALWTLPPGELERLRLLSERWRRARQTLELSARGVTDDEAELSALEAELPSLRATLLTAEDLALVAELDPILARNNELEREELSALRRGAELEISLARLNPPLPRAGLATLPLPSEAELDELLAASHALEREQKAALADLSRATSDLASSRSELAALAAEDLPDPETLPATRSRRDELWSELRRRLSAGETHAFGALFARAEADYAEPEAPGEQRPATATALRQLIRSYERAVAGADTLADRLRDAADGIAKRASLRRQIERAEADLRRAEEILDETARRETAWQERWSATWRPLSVVPGPPSAMISWRRDAAALREAALELSRHELAADQLRPAVDEYTRRLRERLGWPHASLTALAQGLRERDRAAQSAGLNLQLSTNRVAALASSLVRGRTAKESAAREFSEVDAALRARLSAFGLPPELDPDAAIARLHGLDDLSQKLRDIESQRATLARATAALESFDAELSALLARLGRPGEGLSPEHTVDALNRRLAEARAAAAAAAQAREQAVEKRRERDQCAEGRAAAADAVAALMASARVADVPALLNLSERTLKRSRLRQRRDELGVRLARTLGDGPAREAYAAELLAGRRELFAAEQAELDRRVRELDRRRTVALEQAGRLENQVQALGGDRAARLNAESESLLADLTQNVDRYVLLQLAHAVLERVTERYARENQPAILHYTSEMLANITGGRHVRVVPQPDAGTIATLDRSGRLRLPSELSVGTREQLFLALRLAYVLDYCDRNEPLPLVMDDVLVNFDDDRAGTTLQALRKVAETTQILFLTCHRHLAELARRTCSGDAALQIVELPAPSVGPRAAEA